MKVDGKLIAKFLLGVVGTACTIASGVLDPGKDKDETANPKLEKSEK